jgi:hypothetical protein
MQPRPSLPRQSIHIRILILLYLVLALVFAFTVSRWNSALEEQDRLVDRVNQLETRLAAKKPMDSVREGMSESAHSGQR